MLVRMIMARHMRKLRSCDLDYVVIVMTWKRSLAKSQFKTCKDLNSFHYTKLSKMDWVKILECFNCLTGDPTDIATAFKNRNPELFKYFETLVPAVFQGETSNIFDSVTDHNELWPQRNLGAMLYNMDRFIRSKSELFTGNEEEFLEYVQQAAKQRCIKGNNFKRFHRKILRDKTRFVELYRARGTG